MIKDITIVGAGIGGLAFAIALTKLCNEKGIKCPKVTILERDESPDIKLYQNYSMSIRSDSGGLQVLKKLDVYDSCEKHRTVSDGFLISLSHKNKLEQLLSISASSENGLRILRYDFWSELLNHAPKEVDIQWGKTVKLIEEKKEAVYITTNNDSILRADILVSADGNQSKVRELMLREKEKIQFSGATMFSGISNVDPPLLYKNKHGLIMGNDGVSLFLAHESPQKTLWSVSRISDMPTETFSVRNSTIEQQQGVITESLKSLKDWPQEIRNLVNNSDMKTVRILNGYDKLPHKSTGRIIYIGDSCHPVTPFAGNGANMALVDAYTLAELLINNNFESFEKVVDEFNKEMIPRTTKVFYEQRRTISMAHLRGYFSTTLRNTFFRLLGVVISNSKIFLSILAAILFLLTIKTLNWKRAPLIRDQY